MNVSHFIAKRYLKSKKSKNVINWITNISVVGILICTAALVILLSAFNGIENMVVKLYTDFDSDITVRSVKGKTFDQSFIDTTIFAETEGIVAVSRALEEVVILRHKKKWVNARMIGVDEIFVDMAKVSDGHLVDGIPFLYEGDEPLTLIGAGLLDKLDGFVPQSSVKENIVFNVPLREGKVRPGKNPLSVKRVNVAGRINYNNEVNAQFALVPYKLAKELLQYENDITAFYIDVDDNYDVEDVKEELQLKLGADFKAKTNFEKNDLIFKTSKSEKIIIFVILIFIFILASFNLIASLTMLYLEKKPNVSTLFGMGANKKTIFQIFFFEGLMISGRGIIFGLLLGYALCAAQYFGSFIVMPGSGGEPFPIVMTISDGILIIGLVSILGFLASYLPVKYLVKKQSNEHFFDK